MAQDMTATPRIFRYAARDAKGAKTSGTVTARDTVEATELIRSQGLFPVNVAPAAAPASPKKSRKIPASAGKLSTRQSADLLSRLAKLTGRKVTVDRALAVIADGQDGAISAIAGRLRQKLREGTPLSEALRKDAGFEDATTYALLRGAEVSGDLAEALATAARIQRQRLALIRRVGTGLIYPGLLIVIALISFGLIMIAILPQFRPLIEDRFDLVPPLGRAVFALSNLFVALWPVVLTALAGAALALLYLMRTGRAALILRAILARTPFVNRLVRRNQIVMVLYSLGALLSRGVTLSDAMALMGKTAPAGPIRDGMRAAQTQVEGGTSLSVALRETDLLPAAVVEVVRVGEESGRLGEMINESAEDLRETADRDLERMLTVFQPALIIVVGIMIGVSLYALFSAIVSVNAISF